MADASTRLALLGPRGLDASGVGRVAAALAAACAAGDVAAVILQFARTDERALVNLVKRLAPTVQAAEAALVIACPGFVGDLAAVAARGGADGVHVERAGEADLRELRGRLRDGRILGVGGVLDSKHEAMAAGENGVDYVLFGGLYPDGVAPETDAVRERAAWWAEIFETPCVAVAASADEVAGLVATGAEFVGLESGLWLDDAGGVAAAQRLLAGGAA